MKFAQAQAAAKAAFPFHANLGHSYLPIWLEPESGFPLIEHSGHGSIKACAAKARGAPGGRNWEVTMKLARRDFLYFAGTAIAGMAVPTLAWTESYPSRSVRVIVPFAPGGVTDVTARLVASKLSEQFGKQFYVENLGGASGNIGIGQAARAA